jgi:hypothetical protein
MQESAQIEFTRHEGQNCPVPPDQKVIYRTISGGEISHVHRQYPAGLLNWTLTPAIGRIYDYMCVDSEKIQRITQS